MKKKEKNGSLEVIIETPKGSRNKYKYDEEREVFTLHKILPEGFSFPFDFGFIPNTKGGDGDPLDVVLISQQPTFPGCRINSRIIGGIKANQTNGKENERNDRLFAVPTNDKINSPIKDIKDLSKEVIDEVADFFKAYRMQEDVNFIPLGLLSRREAKKIIKSSKS